jgi:SOS-response transcriptional repressor LexA
MPLDPAVTHHHMTFRRPAAPLSANVWSRRRSDSGYSLRRLAEATGIPMSSSNRLLKDEVEEPSTTSVARLAKVLDLNPSERRAGTSTT